MSTEPAAPSASIDPSLREAHAREVEEGRRLAFGKSWASFLGVDGRHGFRLERPTTAGDSMGCDVPVAGRKA